MAARAAGGAAQRASHDCADGCSRFHLLMPPQPPLLLRMQLSNLKPGRLSEEEGVLRTCWAAWDARDRPLKDLIVARSGKNQRR